MALQLRWVGEEDHAKVAMVRHQSFGAAAKDKAFFDESMTLDPRQKPGDFLLAEDKGQPIGTLTALSLNIWMRGAKLPCQGIAWVATTKTSRRTGDKSQPGIATQMMNQALDKARERNEPVTALMPFRASFYEHFGYGLAEKRVEWNIPMGILPKGGPSGFRFIAPGDVEKLMPARQAEAKRGHCEIDTDLPTLQMWAKQFDDGWCMVHQPDASKPPAGYVFFTEELVNGQKLLRVQDWCSSEPSGVLSILTYLGTLKDQFSNVIVTVGADVPVNQLLRESQIPHRFVDHPYANAKPYTRMQIRVLDHKRTLEAMSLPQHVSGEVIVSVKETEGTVSTFRIGIEGGRAQVKPVSTEASFTCPDRTWSSIVGGHLSASDALRWGMAEGDPDRASVLDAFAHGPQPYCQDYF